VVGERRHGEILVSAAEDHLAQVDLAGTIGYNRDHPATVTLMQDAASMRGHPWRSTLAGGLSHLGGLAAEVLDQRGRVEAELPQQLGVALGVDLLGQLLLRPGGRLRVAA
jgi:hypothetical protein